MKTSGVRTETSSKGNPANIIIVNKELFVSLSLTSFIFFGTVLKIKSVSSETAVQIAM
jgi:hypothetical protein